MTILCNLSFAIILLVNVAIKGRLKIGQLQDHQVPRRGSSLTVIHYTFRVYLAQDQQGRRVAIKKYNNNANQQTI